MDVYMHMTEPVALTAVDAIGDAPAATEAEAALTARPRAVLTVDPAQPLTHSPTDV